MSLWQQIFAQFLFSWLSLVHRKWKEHNTCVMAVSCMTCSRQNPSVLSSSFCSEVSLTTDTMNPWIWDRSSSEPSSFSSTGTPVCCPNVVDPYTWVALLGGVLLATYFLRLAIINNISRRRKRRGLPLHEGKLDCPPSSSGKLGQVFYG